MVLVQVCHRDARQPCFLPVARCGEADAKASLEPEARLSVLRLGLTLETNLFGKIEDKVRAVMTQVSWAGWWIIRLPA
jgi:hypothetical protein